mgnify:CR=1 FL=1
MIKKNLDVLLVEDNEDHAFLVKKAIKVSNSCMNCNVYNVCDGEEALEFIYRKGEYSNVPRPDLILMDINMPGKDGFDVLSEIKSSDQYRTIPVIMLTSSENDSDVNKCYSMGSNGYVSKPLKYEDFIDKITRIFSYWLNVNILPPKV